MGREVRKVPADWQHPKDKLTGHFIPMHASGYEERARQWDEDCAKWERGEFPDYASEENKQLPFDQWDGQRPYSGDYMPTWTPEQATHFMMYEDTSEGTPISPAFATPEELARWLADTGASSFGNSTASYEAWLRVCKGGFAPSAVVINGVMQDGVSASVEA